ncbi:Unannotated [Lentimonas sp. CC19]|nr:Unannotated [Lentimonas sp. CC10]CAA6695332.1 Unannotated [Lentimonas sp. CC19]CAA7068827.1 Unannotated [Lentimonas sp. CC11]
MQSKLAADDNLKLENGRRRGIRTHDPLGVNEVL